MDEIKVFGKDDLIAVVNECAIPKGFIQNENVYINKFRAQTQSNMIINGQPVPGHISDIEMKFELCGEGSLSDETKEERFELIEFNIIRDGETVAEYSTIVYYHKPDYFKELFTNIFKL